MRPPGGVAVGTAVVGANERIEQPALDITSSATSAVAKDERTGRELPPLPKYLVASFNSGATKLIRPPTAWATHEQEVPGRSWRGHHDA
ncbi:MAG: hypothetical protein WDA16_02775 [Candidatus Thermoplasmatota archaeon]